MRTKRLACVGTVLTLAMAIGPALAQTENSAAELELSPAAKEILCKQSPLNSRCAGQKQEPTAQPAAQAPAAPVSGEMNETTPPAAPGPEMPQAAPMDSNSNSLEGTTPADGSTPAEASEPTTTPDATTKAPTEAPVAVQPEELQKFAKAFGPLKTIQQQAKQQMVSIIQQEGLSPERFEAMYQAQKNPEAQSQAQMSAEEMQKFERANTKIAQVQQESQSKMQQVIQKEGLNPQRFEEILAAIQRDPLLQQKVQQMLKP